MPSRFVGLRCGCVLFAALLLGRGVQAQCANNADTLPQTCFGINSLASATSGSSNAAFIAEEVAAVNPGLVQFGEDGKPLTVRYHFVNAMLLDEVQKQHATVAAQAARLDEQAAEIAGQKVQIEDLTQRLLRLEAQAAAADGGRTSPSAASRPGPAAPPARPAA